MDRVFTAIEHDALPIDDGVVRNCAILYKANKARIAKRLQ
jgi:hypothetical protein